MLSYLCTTLCQLVAREHAISPLDILRSVSVRRARELWRALKRCLGMDQPRVLPTEYAAILESRALGGHAHPHSDTPQEVLAAVTGVHAELSVEGVMPRTRCFVRVDPTAATLRWAAGQYISIHCIVDLKLMPTPERGLGRRSKRATAAAAQDEASMARYTMSASTAHLQSDPRSVAEQSPATPSAPRWSLGRSSGGARRVVRALYTDRGGALRALRMEVHGGAVKAEAWLAALHALMAEAPTRAAERPHYRWALSCMEAVGSRLGPSRLHGLLRRQDFEQLLNRANICLDEAAQAQALAAADALPLPAWRKPSSPDLLNLQQVHAALCGLAMAQPEIEDLFHRYAPGGRMSLPQWRAFERAKQVGDVLSAPDTAAAEAAEGKAEPETAMEVEVAAALGAEAEATAARWMEAGGGGLGLREFAMLLLSPHNDAVGPAPPQGLKEPLSHYWCATSHNSYIVGDQLTGISSAAAYARQLLQGCRHLEIDCWDSKRGPVVTHGFTLVTVETFGAVAAAVARYAFVTSELPVILSLEMHCSLRQQHRIAELLHHHLGDALLSYDELCTCSDPLLISPHDLRRRVLVKTKVKLRQTRKPLLPGHRSSFGSSLGPLSRRASLTVSVSVSKVLRSGQKSPAPAFESSEAPADEEISAYELSVRPHAHKPPSIEGAGEGGPGEQRDRSQQLRASHAGAASESEADLMAACGATITAPAHSHSSPELITEDALDGPAIYRSRKGTAALLARYTALRAVPQADLLADPPVPLPWALPLASIMEDKLLERMGLSQDERHEIEGLLQPRIASVREAGLLIKALGSAAAADDANSKAHENVDRTKEPDQSSLPSLASDSMRRTESVAARLATEPPAELEKMQRLTRTRLLRAYPLGLRFSGHNMDPLPCWLAGVQSVTLNMCKINDLPVQLHYALFDRSGGYVLKPRGMLDDGGRFPPERQDVHRVSLRVLSLHHLPKRAERRGRREGPHAACHVHLPELSLGLSGANAPPDDAPTSTPSLSFSLHPIGGFCGLASVLPPPFRLPLEMSLGADAAKDAALAGSGLNTRFDRTVHCLAAEPDACLLRVSVLDAGEEVAYETMVLGRLRPGYRTLRLRCQLGTRIELAGLFVHVSFGQEPNHWLSASEIHRRYTGQGVQALEASRRDEVAALRREAKLARQEHLAEAERRAALEAEVASLKEALSRAKERGGRCSRV